MNRRSVAAEQRVKDRDFYGKNPRGAPNSTRWGGDGGEQYEVGWMMAANSAGWGGDGGEQCGLVQFASLPC